MIGWAYQHWFLFFLLAFWAEYLVIVKGQELLLEIVKAMRWR